MQWTPAKLCLVVVSVGLLGAGGYAGSQYLTCQGLHDDYLNSVSQLKSTTASLSILKEQPAADALTFIREQEMKKAEEALLGLHKQCGNRAAETALREGTDILLP